MTAHPLPTGTPAAEGVDAGGVHAFLDVLESSPGITPHSLMILRHGRVIAEGWWAPYTPERPQLLYSLSKSFTSAAAGLAVGEGLLDLDAPVLSYFPELDADVTDPGSRAMLVRHIASMATGHIEDTWSRVFGGAGGEPVRDFLRIPPDSAPGTLFAYNQSATYTLAAIIQRVTGGRLTEYLRPRLLDPLGIGPVTWQYDRTGREIGFSGLHAATHAVARLGQLHLQGGRWEDRQLLPASWVAEATRRHIDNPGMPAPDWHQGYGFQFWMSRHGYRGDGAFGQFCVVLPEQDAVIAMTSETEQMQAVLDAVWEHLLPAFRGGSRADAGGTGGLPGQAAEAAGAADVADAKDDASAGEETADESLRRRLASLTVPPPAAKPAPTTPADWFGVPFTPADDDATRHVGVTAVTLASVADGGWDLALAESGGDLVVRHDTTGWTVNERPSVPVPVAASGGWTDAGTFTADLVFLETPHCLTVNCSLPTRTFTARWHTAPLGGGLLRAHGAPGKHAAADELTTRQ